MSISRIPQRKKDEAPLSRIITLGEITNESANEVIGLIYEINKLDKISKTTKREPIILILNSPGGETYDGMGIVDVIENSLTPIHIKCHGHVMSMAFVICVVGHYRAASKRTRFMYHDASYELNGKTRYHEQELKECKEINKIYDDIVVAKTNIPQSKLTKIVNNKTEWYLNAEEALEFGIIDEII